MTACSHGERSSTRLILRLGTFRRNSLCNNLDTPQTIVHPRRCKMRLRILVVPSSHRELFPNRKTYPPRTANQAFAPPSENCSSAEFASTGDVLTANSRSSCLSAAGCECAPCPCSPGDVEVGVVMIMIMARDMRRASTSGADWGPIVSHRNSPIDLFDSQPLKYVRHQQLEPHVLHARGELGQFKMLARCVCGRCKRGIRYQNQRRPSHRLTRKNTRIIKTKHARGSGCAPLS